ncbi:ADP-ribose pyrophosphatase [uncultured Clostridium sp.]|uniref:NUDIX domain-containing protein n=1 Tax=uncultured Clostridium sp. TaxID=59620 RepID=UPI0008205C8B|nr:NUDIX hydrolase [uncultured Clostridium sp.]SCI91020.1 ADP-ribose pyrophosphatase [uncultured Clostridium sp.]
MKFYEKTLNEKHIYTGNYLEILNVDVELPDGNKSNRDIIKHPGACAIIPFLDNETVLLVEQFRKPLEKMILEIPAGKLDKDEDPLKCAYRELEEETGYKAKSMTYLGSIATAPGFCDEIIHLYKAENLSLGSKCCDEDEFTQVKSFSLNQVKSMVKEGKIIDTKTISILAYL